VSIAVVFERRRFGEFGECDNSLEKSGGKPFVLKVFLVFSSEGMKDLNASVTFYRIVALTSSVIWLIMASDRINSWF
jgi:hypothetical protein